MALSIKPYIENKERIHLIGIGGVSMSALGELLLSLGVPVSGSDRLKTDVTARSRSAQRSPMSTRRKMWKAHR